LGQGIEWKNEKEFKLAFPFALNGKIDCMAESGDVVFLLDFKSTKFSASTSKQVETFEGLQLWVYALASACEIKNFAQKSIVMGFIALDNPSESNLLFSDRPAFLEQLRNDILLLIKKAKAEGKTPCVRLNGTSDLGWEGLAKSIMEEFSDVQFYDYTKVLPRMKRFCEGKFPKNYHLTFSRSECNWEDCKIVLSLGGNVASVFYKVLPDNYEGYKVIDGDLSDLRFLDDKNVIVGLKAKGKAKYDESGFVVFA
jgi:hypothetical protein